MQWLEKKGTDKTGTHTFQQLGSNINHKATVKQ